MLPLNTHAKRYNYTFTEMTIIKKMANTKCWRKCVETGTLIYYLW